MPFHRASGLVQLDFVNEQERLTKADNRAGKRLAVGGDNAKALFSLTFLSSTVYLYSTNRPAKPAMPEPPRAPRLLDQLRQHIRYFIAAYERSSAASSGCGVSSALSPQSTDSRTGYVSNSGFACPYLYIVARRPATG
ncbi:MAG: hypothetical protein ACK5WG_00385 [Betaproteobacteria bacterium]